jgi:hypothetical protein
VGLWASGQVGQLPCGFVGRRAFWTAIKVPVGQISHWPIDQRAIGHTSHSTTSLHTTLDYLPPHHTRLPPSTSHSTTSLHITLDYLPPLTLDYLPPQWTDVFSELPIQRRPSPSSLATGKYYTSAFPCVITVLSYCVLIFSRLSVRFNLSFWYLLYSQTVSRHIVAPR